MGRRQKWLGTAIISLMVYCLVPAVMASPWGRGEDSFFLLSRADYFRAKGDFLASSEEKDLFERLENHTYFEFGLAKRITLGGKVVYGSSILSNDFENRSGTGFSQIEAFLQYQVIQMGRTVGAIQILADAPQTLGAGTRPDIANNGPGSELRFLYGRSFPINQGNLFVAAEAAYHKNWGARADQILFDARVGYEPSKYWLILLESFNAQSLRNEDMGGSDFDAYKIQPSIVWRVTPRWALQAGVTHEYEGRNLALGNTFFIGLWSSL